MNAESMMVDPNELVIDMPIDEANVKVKMESLAVNGVIQQVTVWLQGMRIIDGFHRTEAARRLGWTAIPCRVVDCSEAAFWDARIQSAKQHHAIEEERLQTWIRECWRASDWPNVIAVMKDGQLRVSNPAVIDVFLSNKREQYVIQPKNRFERWLVEDRGLKYWYELATISDADMKKVKGLSPARRAILREKQQRAEDGISLDGVNPLTNHYRQRKEFEHFFRKKVRELTDGDESLTVALYAVHSGGELSNELGEWFNGKAKQWGIDKYSLVRTILSELVDIKRISHAIEATQEIIGDLTINDAEALAKVLPVGEHVLYEGDELLIRNYLKNRQQGESLRQYRKRKDDEDYLRRKAQAEENARLERRARAEEQAQYQRQQAYMQTEAGKAQAEMERIQQNRGNITQLLRSAKLEVQKAGYWLADVPEAPAMLAEFAQFVADFANEHFPGIDIAKPNPVSLDNARLRAENSKLREQVRSLERALGSKQAAGEMLPRAMAWSSGDFDGQ